jgi:hypothetical protein
MILLLATALAGDPTCVLTDDGTVLATVSLPASVETVRAKLEDPHFVARVYEGGTQVKTTAAGPCLRADYVAPNALMTARYSVRQCTKGDTIEATLLESNTFSEYQTTWSLVARDDGGTDVTYRLWTVPKGLIPTGLVRRASRKSIAELMTKLRAHFTPG